MLIDEDIERLEGPRWPTLASQSAETKMWKRSYLMALYALDVVRKRAPKPQPMIFFYDPPGSEWHG